jgi:hypothetical protein
MVPYRFAIVTCYHCGNILISRLKHHTKLCTYCHKRVSLRNANVVAKTKTASEASQIAKELKAKYSRK